MIVMETYVIANKQGRVVRQIGRRSANDKPVNIYIKTTQFLRASYQVDDSATNWLGSADWGAILNWALAWGAPGDLPTASDSNK